MPRFSFGGELPTGIADRLTAVGQPYDGALKGAAVGTFGPFYDARGGAVVSDYLLFNAATSAYDIPATTITTTSASNLPMFQGPNDLSVLWFQIGTEWLRYRAFDANASGSSVTNYSQIQSLPGFPVVSATGATEDAALNAIGGTDVGKTIFKAVNAAAVFTKLGIVSATVRNFLTAANTTAALDAIGAAAYSAVLRLAANADGTMQTITQKPHFAAGFTMPNSSIPAAYVADLDLAIREELAGLGIGPTVILEEGDPLPTNPAPRTLIGYVEAAVSVDPVRVSGFVSGTDGKTFAFTQSRVFLANEAVFAWVASGVPSGTTAPYPSLQSATPKGLVLGGKTMEIVTLPDATPVQMINSAGVVTSTLYRSTGGTPSGTTGSVNFPAGGVDAGGISIQVFAVPDRTFVKAAMANGVTAATSYSITADPANNLLSFMTLNSSLADPLLPVNPGSGFVEVGAAATAPAAPPALTTKAFWAAVGRNTITVTDFPNVSKMAATVELAPV